MTRAASLSLVLCLLAVPSVAVAEVKLGVVSVKEVMNSTDHWKSAYGQLEKDRKSKQVVLESKQRELRERKDRLDAKKAVSAADATIKEEEEIFREAQELTQQFLAQQQELTVWEKRITGEMLERVRLMVREVAVINEIEYVLQVGADEQPNVLYADKKIDLTPKVIKLYKKRYKGKPLQSIKDLKKKK